MKKIFLFIAFFIKIQASSVINLAPEQWREYKGLRLFMLQDQPESFGATYEEEALYPDEQWKKYLIEAELEKRTILRFFLKDEQVVGMAGVKLGSTTKTKHKATLFSVFVKPEERGKGIAKALIFALIKRLEEKNIKQIDLVVNIKQEAAISLYKSLGFVVEGCFKNFWYQNDEYQDVYSMEKYIETI